MSIPNGGGGRDSNMYILQKWWFKVNRSIEERVYPGVGCHVVEELEYIYCENSEYFIM